MTNERFEIDTEQWAVVPRVPTVTNEMKARFIGEFSWTEEGAYYDEDGIEHECEMVHTVPWDLCKRIFKEMAAHWIAAAPRPEAGQQDGAVIDYGSIDQLSEFIQIFNAAFEALSEGHSIGICWDLMKCAKAELNKLAKQRPAPRLVPTSERLAGGRILTCVYCGHEYPQDTPAHGSKVLTDHISQCEKHPMREVIDQRDKLKSALAGLIGASDSAELRNMELIIRLSTAPAADKAAMLDAIHVLLNVAEQPTGIVRPAEPDGGE